MKDTSGSRSSREPTGPRCFEKNNWKTAATESHRADVPDDRNDAIRDLFLSAAITKFDLATVATVRQLVGQHLSELLKFIAAGQDSSKFYPYGITKIHVSIKVAGVESNLELEGPDHASKLSASRSG
jgi:hypothetical protein